MFSLTEYTITDNRQFKLYPFEIVDPSYCTVTKSLAISPSDTFPTVFNVPSVPAVSFFQLNSFDVLQNQRVRNVQLEFTYTSGTS